MKVLKMMKKTSWSDWPFWKKLWGEISANGELKRRYRRQRRAEASRSAPMASWSVAIGANGDAQVSSSASLKRRHRRSSSVAIGVDRQWRRLASRSVWVGVVSVTVELNRRWFELHQWRLSSTATMGWSCRRFGVGFLVFFFFWTEMAIEMFCSSWFLLGLGIEIRLISL